MRPLPRLTDDDLVAVADQTASDLSYCVAGWDFDNQAESEKRWERRLRRQFEPIRMEMRRRGLSLTVRSLVSL